jgi:hypothetical protein
MNQTMNNWNVQLIGMLAIAAAVFGVFWAAEGIEEAWPSAAILLGFIAILHFGRDRSDTLNVMSGVGRRAHALALHTGRGLRGQRDGLRAAGLVARDGRPGRPQRTLTVLCAIFGVTFIAAVAVLARRS